MRTLSGIAMYRLRAQFPLALALSFGGVVLAPRLLAQAAVHATEHAEHEARSAQRAFEAYRRFELPRTPPEESRCDVAIGRLCYWDDNDDPPLPAEPRQVARARTKLRARLDEIARTAPDDDWIRGQQVRYALEAHDNAAADSLAASCTGTPWWCASLVGLVQHSAGNDSSAARAFATALQAMPDTLRCQWLDVRPWLPSHVPDSVQHAPCEARVTIAARLFWLAAPLLTWRPAATGNEWFARRTMTLLTQGTSVPILLVWGSDIAETALRFGWPVRWAREDDNQPVLDPMQIPVVGHEPAPSWSLVPAAHALADPEHAAPPDWTLSHAVTPPMRYAPLGLHRLVQITDVQIARFRRDSAMRVVAAYDARDALRDSANDPTTNAVAAAVLSAGPGETIARTRNAPGETAGTLVLDAPRSTGLAAVEVLDTAHAQAARWRAGFEPLRTDALVSDLLVGRATDEPVPPKLDSVLPLATGSLTVPVGATLALYWECYATASPTAPVTVRLRLVPRRAGLFSRVGHVFGLARGNSPPISLEWSDPGRGDNAPGRSLRLALPAIPPGRYRLELVIAGDTLRGRASREIVITAH